MTKAVVPMSFHQAWSLANELRLAVDHRNYVALAHGVHSEKYSEAAAAEDAAMHALLDVLQGL